MMCGYWGRKMVAAMVLLHLAAAIACGRSQGELTSTKYDFRWVDDIRVVGNSVKIAVTGSSDNIVIDATLDSRRKIVVDERGSEVVIEISRVNGVTTIGADEILELRVPDGTRLRVDSGSGKVEIIDLTETELSVETGSGVVEITRVEGIINARSGSGGIWIDQIKAELSLTSSSGPIRGSSVELTADSKFVAESGRIEIDLLNKEEGLAFDLRAGSGSIRINGIRGTERLAFGGGTIKITGETRSGSQEYHTK